MLRWRWPRLSASASRIARPLSLPPTCSLVFVPEEKQLARRVSRIGVATLTERDGHFFMRLQNRTYDHKCEVPAWRVPYWVEWFKYRRPPSP